MNETTAEPTPARKHPRAGLIGPLFSWELIRLARRGQDMRGRFILASSLLLVLTLFTLIWFRNTDPIELFTGTDQSLSLEESSRFGQWFSLTFVMTQLVVMCLLTPAYAAGGISEEKEKQTLIFLLVSDLTSREILFGKFLGRVTFLLGILFAGLPILSLTQLYGGVSINYLIISYFITTTTTIMLAAISAASALYAETFRGALFRSYSFTALFIFVGFGLPYLSPLAILPFLSSMEGDNINGFWIVGLVYGVGELFLASIAVLIGTYKTQTMRARPIAVKDGNRDEARLKRREDRRKNPIPVKKRNTTQSADLIILGDEDVARPVAVALPVSLPSAKRVTSVPTEEKERTTIPQESEQPRFRRRLRPQAVRRPPIGSYIKPRPRIDEEAPFLWKERFVTGRKNNGDDESIRSVLIAVALAVGIVVGFVGLIITFIVLVSSFSRGALDALSNFTLVVGLSGFTVYLLMIGSSATGSVIGERQRQTLDSLLTIPVDRNEILFPKWRVSIFKAWWWGAASAVLILVGFVASKTPTLSIVSLVSIVIAPPIAVSYGLWLSVRCRTATKAVLWLLLGIAAIISVPFSAWTTATFEDELLWLAGLSAANITLALIGLACYYRAMKEFEAKR